MSTKKLWNKGKIVGLKANVSRRSITCYPQSNYCKIDEWPLSVTVAKQAE